MLQPEYSIVGDERRIGNSSASSSRSFSQDVISTPSAAAIAQDREANLRTPRPHTASAAVNRDSKTTRDSGRNHDVPLSAISPTDDLNALQWHQRREASENTLDGNGRATSPERYYPSDSMGRISIASSAITSGIGSEFGHSIRSASEAGTDWNGTSSSASGSAARKMRKVAPPELLVVVRPPPSKQTNPLNLQIQLVTPQTSASTQQGSVGRTSGESSRDELGLPQSASTTSTFSTGNNFSNAVGNSTNNLASNLNNPQPLRRSNSVTSSRSAMSESSSVAYSIASASSVSRRVTPLYNLCFHSIVATTVTDAGTDQKVAKFSKRGVEIDGFGMLVPHELALGVNDLASIEKRRRSTLAQSVHSGNGESTSISTNGEGGAGEVKSSVAAASSSSGGSGSGIQLPDTSIEPPTSFDAMSPQAKEAPTDLVGGLGGKLMRGFKRLSLNPATSAVPIGKQVPTTPNSVRSSATLESTQSSGLLARLKGAAAVKAREGDGVDDTDGQRQGEGDQLLVDPMGGVLEIPQLVVGAGIRGDGSRRAQGYYWTVGRWSRRNGDDLSGIDDVVPGRRDAGANPILNSVWKRFNLLNRMGGVELHPPARNIPVRFEWTRTEVRKRSTAAASSMAAGRSGSHGAASGMHTRAATEMLGRSSLRGSIDGRGTAVEQPPRRDSGDALQPPTPKSASRPSSLYAPVGGAQSPARASLDRGSALSTGEDSDPEDSETKWACHLVLGPSTRIPIGSLAPTPHHPKLVAQLTVPYPLPDLSQSGLGADGAGLTREELKDIISVTALFVIVREAFGGLAKRRKGDSAIKFGAAVAQRT